MWNWINALIPFALFCFLAVLFTRKRFGTKTTYIVWAAVIAAVSITHIVVFAANMGELLLSMMAVTAYLPVIAAFFVLSRRNVVSNLLAVLIAALCSTSVILMNAFAGKLWAKAMSSAHWGAVFSAVNFIVPLIVSAGLGFVAYRFLREVFAREKVLENKTWYVLPAVSLLLLFSLYQMEVVKQPALIAFILVMNVSVLAVIVAFIVSKFKNIQAEERRAAVEKQLTAEREQYGALKTSIEKDKRYRHDIKHHFSAIAELANKRNNGEIAQYVNSLGARLTEAETKWYCVNGVVNAVLSAFVKRAEEAGAETHVEAVVPDQPPADVCDLCALVGNALDNALNACLKIDGGKRKIDVSVKCEEAKTVIKITNTTAGRVLLNKDGLPFYERTEEHGWGLSSIRHIVDGYSGIMQCKSEDNSFTLGAVLFKKGAIRPAAARSRKKTTLYSIAAVPMIIVTAILSLNCMPATVAAMQEIPVLGKAFEIIDFRTWGWNWGDSGIDIEQPITNDPGANEIIAGYVKECRDRFDWYYARKYHGYVYSEFTSKEIVNDDRMYVLSMSCIIQAGSSAEYMRYFVVDKEKGEIAALDDLFQSGSDWNTVLSAEILRQMKDIVQKDEGDFFGFGRFADTPGFTRLNDPNFYIDADGRLTIVFDEQEVAPGNMGSPKFVIPYQTVKDILSVNSLLKEDA